MSKTDGKLKFLKFHILFMLVYRYILRHYGLFYDENKLISFLKWFIQKFLHNLSCSSFFLENDLTASQDMYDCLAKESYNVLTLTTTDIEQL